MGGPGSGRGGISLVKVQRAERLLAQGWSMRRVGARLGLSLCTVHRIKHGDHFLQLVLDESRCDRCPECGALLTQEPCVLCTMRRAGL